MLALHVFEQHLQQSSKNGSMGQNFDDKNLDGLVISHGGEGWNPAFHGGWGGANIQEGAESLGRADTPLHSMDRITLRQYFGVVFFFISKNIEKI